MGSLLVNKITYSISKRISDKLSDRTPAFVDAGKVVLAGKKEEVNLSPIAEQKIMAEKPRQKKRLDVYVRGKETNLFFSSSYKADEIMQTIKVIESLGFYDCFFIDVTSIAKNVVTKLCCAYEDFKKDEDWKSLLDFINVGTNINESSNSNLVKYNVTFYYMKDNNPYKDEKFVADLLQISDLRTQSNPKQRKECSWILSFYLSLFEVNSILTLKEEEFKKWTLSPIESVVYNSGETHAIKRLAKGPNIDRDSFINKGSKKGGSVSEFFDNWIKKK